MNDCEVLSTSDLAFIALFLFSWPQCVLDLIERKEIGYPHKLETPAEISNYFAVLVMTKI